MSTDRPAPVPDEVLRTWGAYDHEAQRGNESWDARDLASELLALRESARASRAALDYTLTVLAERGWIPQSRAYRLCGAAMAQIDALVPEE